MESGESKEETRPRTKEAPKAEITLLDLKRVHDNGTELLKKQEGALNVENEKAEELENNLHEEARTIIMQKYVRQVYIIQLQRELKNINNAIKGFGVEPISIDTVASYVIASRALDRLNALMPIEEIERFSEGNEKTQERFREVRKTLAQEIPVIDDDSLSFFFGKMGFEFLDVIDDMEDMDQEWEDVREDMLRELEGRLEDKTKAAAVPPQHDAEESERNRKKK
jgi:hypothetical protein